MGQIKIEQIEDYYLKVALEPPAYIICLHNSNWAHFWLRHVYILIGKYIKQHVMIFI